VSPRRIHFYDDPDAPKANSLVPSVNVVVVNDAGEILLIRHRGARRPRRSMSPMHPPARAETIVGIVLMRDPYQRLHAVKTGYVELATG
jgi:hypothetical protein